MHPCLMVDEILRVVFRYIEDRMTWCALARTCRTFNEPASDLIWETLVYLPLITRNLSCERISCEGKHPPLNDNDWDVVRRISSHVRRLHLYPFPIDDDVHPWFSILTSPPDPNFLFANLRLLSFESRYAEDTEVASQIVTHLIPLLLRPRLFALRFNIPGKIYTYLNIPSIPMLCPNIRVLSIADREIKWNENSIPDEAVYLLSRVVSELGDLEMFRSNITSWDLLSSLAHARALRQLWTYLPRWLGPRTERPSGSIFPQLRTLNIRAISLASCTGFLRWTPLTKVTEISVRCSASTDDDDVSRALVEMSSLISSQCTALEFVFFFMDSFPYKAVPSSCPRPMLEPYQACHQLRVIALETPYNLTLTDNDLEDLVKAWPHLEVFHLLHDGREDPLVRLTLRGITSLLYHCPKLTHFTLLFDATRVPEDTTLLSHGTLPVVKYMGVDRSPISTSSDVAAYFSNTMPYLEMISVHCGWGYCAEWAWLCNQHQHRPVTQQGACPWDLYSLLSANADYYTELCGSNWWWTFGP